MVVMVMVVMVVMVMVVMVVMVKEHHNDRAEFHSCRGSRCNSIMDKHRVMNDSLSGAVEDMQAALISFKASSMRGGVHLI